MSSLTCSAVRLTGLPSRSIALHPRRALGQGKTPVRGGWRSISWAVRAEDEDRPKVEGEDEEEIPPWERREKERKMMEGEPQDLPFGLYLLFSSMVAIAAVGSIFEYTNQNPIFGVLGPESPLYKPILGTFVFTGFPMSAFLFYKCIKSANAESERMDKMDGMF